MRIFIHALYLKECIVLCNPDLGSIKGLFIGLMGPAEHIRLTDLEPVGFCPR
jgi:hypothetical protein